MARLLPADPHPIGRTTPQVAPTMRTKPTTPRSRPPALAAIHRTWPPWAQHRPRPRGTQTLARNRRANDHSSGRIGLFACSLHFCGSHDKVGMTGAQAFLEPYKEIHWPVPCPPASRAACVHALTIAIPMRSIQPTFVFRGLSTWIAAWQKGNHSLLYCFPSHHFPYHFFLIPVQLLFGLPCVHLMCFLFEALGCIHQIPQLHYTTITGQ